ncbi:MAG TPA: LuxR C-terminal-related transcriptional regulator [Lapillicoccus sp.]|nr:LuxR C-terminal-related transcriptional regulator [Lapillicoccus sp.]
MPTLPRWSVPRERLAAPEARDGVAAPDRGAIVVVTGPGGAGKSTLMAAWASELAVRGEGVGWASLGSDDNEPAMLWSTLLGALADAVVRGAELGGIRGDSDIERALAVEAREAIEAMRPPVGPASSAFVGRLARVLRDVPFPVWLLLDDVHLVRDPAALESMNQLLRWAPASLHLVLGARADPALHLPRLRLEGRVRDIRDSDLRFRPAEAEAMLAAHGVRLTHTQLNRLHSLTEGWAAGLGLAAASLRTGRDVDHFLTSFAGDTGAMAGYLIQEVLAGLDQDALDFMLLTCVAERLTPELAQRLSGRDDAGEMLGKLADANTLVSVTSGAVTTYRYHSLLRGYLNARLKSLGRTRFGQLHAQTATWFSEHGLDAEALEHAVVSQDEQVAHTMLHRYGVRLVLSGRGSTVGRALENAPASVRTERPMEALAAIVAVDSGDLLAGEVHVAAAEAALPASLTAAPFAADGDAADAALPADRLVRLARLSVQRIRGDVDLTALDDVTHRDPATTRTLRDLELLERMNAGVALLAVGRYEEGAAELEETLRLARRGGYEYTVMVCLAHLAGAAASRGDLAGMGTWSEAALAYARPRGWASSPQLLYAYILAAAGAYSAGDLALARRLSDAAEAILDGGSSALDTGSLDRERIDVEPLLARAGQAVASYIAFTEAGDDPGRRRSIVRERAAVVEELDATYPVPLAAYEISEHHRMAVLTAQLDLADAAVGVAERIPEMAGDALTMHAYQAMRQVHDREARGFVAPVLSGEVLCVAVTSTITAWLVEATLALRNDQLAVAHEALLRALDLAGPRCCVRLMRDVSSEVVDALTYGRGRFGPHEAFVEKVLSGDIVGLSGPHGGQDGGGIAAALTPRELSLLQDLPSLMTVAEIARARAVSPNTVKTQLRSLFTKLGVGTRREAVTEGRRRGLV